MFKSSEKLRHEAAQRSLDRIASPWRAARTTWFDGTPESIEARLASTDRVLTLARSGYTPAHLGLTVEAENARRELLAARHRLLVDFLDDGARAFKGSRRVTADETTGFAWQSDDPLDDDDPYFQDEGFRQDADDLHDWMRRHRELHGPDPDDPARYSSHTAAGAGLTGGDHWRDQVAEDGYYDDDPHADADYDELRELRRLRREDHPDHYPELDDPARYSSRQAGTSRNAPGGANERARAQDLDQAARERTAGNAEWHARQESERDPEMRGNYYDGPDTGDCRHCGERIQERGDGSYGHLDGGVDPYTGDDTFYEADHPAEPDDDEDYR